MTDHDDDCRLDLVLADGTLCRLTFATTVRTLAATGHTICVQNGAVQVTPPVDEDTLAELETHWSAIPAILADAPGVH